MKLSFVSNAKTTVEIKSINQRTSGVKNKLDKVLHGFALNICKRRLNRTVTIIGLSMRFFNILAQFAIPAYLGCIGGRSCDLLLNSFLTVFSSSLNS